MSAPFASYREAARALLNSEAALTVKAGQFAGGLCYSDAPLTDKQTAWLATLLERAGLPPLAEGI